MFLARGPAVNFALVRAFTRPHGVALLFALGQAMVLRERLTRALRRMWPPRQIPAIRRIRALLRLRQWSARAMIGLCTAAGVAGPVMAADNVSASLAQYRLQQPGEPPRIERLLAYGSLLRLDDGDPMGDFVIYDADTHQVYSVRHETRTVVIIDADNPPDIGSPIALERKTLVVPGTGAPNVGPVEPQVAQLRVNGQDCALRATLPGVLPELASLWQRMRAVLAVSHLRVLTSIPADLHEACDLALNVFHSGWILDAGIPVVLAGKGVRGRQLIHFEDAAKTDPALFVVPSAYTRMTLPGTE